MMTEDLQKKIARLQDIIKSYGRVAVAFSAGVDSTLVLKVAKEVLPPGHVLAITVSSDFVPAADVAEAKAFCKAEGLEHQVVELDPLIYYDVRTNPPERCYFCKRLVLGQLRELAGRANIVHLLDGTNADDGQDYRPGHKAVRQLGVLSPLKEAGFTKADIRAYARELGLSNADKPSAACLASRIPYGEELTAAKLKRVAAAEAYFHDLGFVQLRVRSHGDLARIELLPDDVERFLQGDLREQAANKLKELGFAYVTLDLQGYRMGSLNEVLKGN